MLVVDWSRKRTTHLCPQNVYKMIQLWLRREMSYTHDFLCPWIRLPVVKFDHSLLQISSPAGNQIWRPGSQSLPPGSPTLSPEAQFRRGVAELGSGQ